MHDYSPNGFGGVPPLAPYDLLEINHRLQEMLMKQQQTIVLQQERISSLEDKLEDYHRLLFGENES